MEAESTLQKHIAGTFGVSRWTIRRWCMRLGIAHHTTGGFRKGTKGNLPHIHEEMPFGIGMLFDLDDDGDFGRAFNFEQPWFTLSTLPCLQNFAGFAIAQSIVADDVHKIAQSDRRMSRHFWQA
jgi:hypothetical protein